MPDRSRVRELFAEFNRKGDPTGWFDHLYREAAEGKAQIPWDDGVPNPHLLDFLRKHPRQAEGAGKSALVIACGLGNDAEFLADAGFTTTAFDISPAAIVAALRRFPDTRVTYVSANLLDPPAQWKQQFDFVLEINTLQALPASIRKGAIEKIAAFVAPAGTLLVIARARDESEPEGEIPWPLTRTELDHFKRLGLLEQTFEDLRDSEDASAVRRFRISYTRPK
jgi:SAM-dependent methyltransferase